MKDREGCSIVDFNVDRYGGYVIVQEGRDYGGHSMFSSDFATYGDPNPGIFKGWENVEKPPTAKQLKAFKKAERASKYRWRNRMKQQIDDLANDVFEKYKDTKHFPTSYNYPYDNARMENLTRNECRKFAARIIDTWRK